jgi:sarcosine oxidase
VNRFDVIVLGLGAMGSATLYQLAKRGANVLGIDRFSPPHAHGSTHGDTRVTRLAIGEGAHYTPLAQRSHQIWRELEAATGAELLTENGGLIISSGSDERLFHGGAFFATTVEAARRHAIPHQLLDAAEIRRRFPQFAVGDGTRGYFEPSAGFVRPETCIRAQLKQAENFGASIQLEEPVQSLEQSGNDIHVTTNRGRYSADRLVVTAGPWLPELLPELASHFKIYRQVLYWFDIEAHFADFTPARFPIFIWELPGEGAGIYGFPAIDGAKGGFKISTEQYLETTSPGTVARDVTPAEIATMYRELVAPHIKGASAHCIKAITCLYTVTRDFGFVIDRHPQHDRIIVASPCSGHGFKHSAALGEAIGDIVMSKPSRFDLGAFTLARLQNHPK